MAVPRALQGEGIASDRQKRPTDVDEQANKQESEQENRQMVKKLRQAIKYSIKKQRQASEQASKFSRLKILDGKQIALDNQNPTDSKRQAREQSKHQASKQGGKQASEPVQARDSVLRQKTIGGSTKAKGSIRFFFFYTGEPGNTTLNQRQANKQEERENKPASESRRN